MAKLNAAQAENTRRRQQTYRDRNKARGKVYFTAWLTPDLEAAIRAFIATWNPVDKNTNGPTEK